MSTTIPQIFSPTQRRLSCVRAMKSAKQDSFFLHDWAARDIADRLKDIKRSFTSPYTLDRYADTVCDDEVLPIEPGTHDLITSNLYLHTLNDLPGMLIQIRRTLKPNGLFIGAMMGGETLHELRHAMTQAEMDLRGGLSPRVAPFADKQQMGELMQRAGYALPVIDSDIITVTYRDFYKLLHDLRHMGENNMLAARSKSFTPRTLFSRTQEIYRDLYSDADGLIRATFEIIFVLGWAPHDSQPRPLKPGTAQVRLSDILSNEETE